MFPFLAGTAPDLVRNNFQSQTSLLMNVSQNVVNASMQLGELNAQAARKLMEESTTAITKGLQIRTPADVQSFIAEQTQVTLDRISGYALNVQRIATQNWFGAGKPAAVPVPQLSIQPHTANDDATEKEAASHGQHDANPQPSQLVEKLVSSVVNSQDKLH